MKIANGKGKKLGEVNDPWISRELMLAYFADKDVISPKVRIDFDKTRIRADSLAKRRRS